MKKRGRKVSDCHPKKDFMRHIFNIIAAEGSEVLPLKTVEMLKEKMARAEDKFKFSIYGGNPARLVEFLSSEDWADIVRFAKSAQALSLLERALTELAESYRDGCPDVAAKAQEALASLAKGVEQPRETIQTVLAKLKLHGFKAELVGEGEKEHIVVKEPLSTMEIKITEEGLTFTYHRQGKAKSTEEIITFLRKMREI